MISIITPTVRPEGLAQVRKSLKRQTYKDFEWIIITPNIKEMMLDFPVKARVLEDPPKKSGDYWTFNKAMNKAVANAKGDLIISIQDYTEFSPEGLEKFWYFFTHGYDKALVSGVGDKINLNGQKVWVDPRKRTDQGTFYECYPNDIEFNYCSVPKKAFYEVGGMDEALDKYAGMDHISLQERLDEVGYKFYLDQTNETTSLVHDRLPNWDKNHAMHGGYLERKKELIEAGKWPYLNYL